MVVIEDAEGPTSIAGLDGRRALGGAGRTTRVLLEVAQLARPQHPPHLVGAGPAQRGVVALREGARARAVPVGAGGRDQADGRAVRGDASCRARSTSAGGPAPPRRSVCARPACSAILGVEIPRARQAEILNALDFDDGRRAGRPGRDAAAGAPRGRHARGGPDRGGRADRRPGAAARDAARSPGRLRRALARAAIAPARAWTRWWVAGCMRRSDGRSPRRARRPPAPGCRGPRARRAGVENPLSEEQSLLRTTLLGSLLDAARATSRAAGTTCACSRPGPCSRRPKRPAAPDGRW